MIDCAPQLHLFAMHERPGYEYAVPGIGVLCETPTLFAGAGTYRNSVRTQSNYAMAGRYFYSTPQLKVGAMLGVVDGYRHQGEYTPMGALVLSWPLWRGAVGNVAAFPAVASGAMNSPSTVQFSIIFKAWK